MAEQKTRGRPRKTAVSDAQETKPKKKKAKKKATSKKKDVRAILADFEGEEIGHFSREHIIARWNAIRDETLVSLFDFAVARHYQGTGAAMGLYLGAIQNLDREEALKEGREIGNGGKVEIQVNIPGFSADNVTVAGQPVPKDG